MKGLHLATLAAAAILVPAAASAQAGSGKPANLCQELVAYVHPPAPAQAPAAPAAGQPAAGQPNSGQPSAGQPTSAVQAPAPGQQSGGPSAAAGETQQKSGMSGPVAQNGPGASGPQGAAQADAKATAPQAAAPATPAAPAAPPPPLKPTPEMIERVDAAARDNSIAACRDAARAMRVAGIPMPAPLLALSALDPKFFTPAQ
ncbi:hypothetical protein J2X36_002687 [Methylobacterium sp. BE186]|uniref:hypothetical protein n=1 Tax=Methylobacterium sp. BE186 TaxID=2817715 RepID=UPI0028548426|nr:hypothetical protein [Methylobacterium sp. BE186]MDR7037934.1 hypothetical protein [Methylobacterium sp. BE186]